MRWPAFIAVATVLVVSGCAQAPSQPTGPTASATTPIPKGGNVTFECQSLDCHGTMRSAALDCGVTARLSGFFSTSGSGPSRLRLYDGNSRAVWDVDLDNQEGYWTWFHTGDKVQFQGTAGSWHLALEDQTTKQQRGYNFQIKMGC